MSLAAVGAAVAVALAAPGGDEGGTVRFAVKGDWGDATPAQAAVTRRMCAEARRAPFAFVLTTGDNFSRPDGVATPDNWDRPEACLIRMGVRWRATWGNHDLAGTATADVLGAARRWYTFAAGPARIVVLDGNRPDDPAQARFLRRALERAREPLRIVAVHQPVRTSGIHGASAAAQRRWEPLLRAGGVALVLQGHNHMYERIEADGVTYVTTAGGGAQLYPCVWPVAGLRACALEHHFLVITATARRAVVRAITPRGRAIETVTVPARA
ncbi:metallophosphoesterase family protein [Miltoncostaea marina]|uniref:metallophosphoesterase family protein n=1 Tax=Miltoncostaea marina TaxID=2843215 RepID=UPI001C3E29C5|nr:metallophosphoesterase [Miltoncostaea marina]